MLCFNVLPAWFKSYNITFKVNKMQKVCMQGLQNIGLYNYWAYIKNVWNPMHVVFGCSSLRTGNGWVVNVMMYCTQTQSNVIRLYHTLVTTISTSDWEQDWIFCSAFWIVPSISTIDSLLILNRTKCIDVVYIQNTCTLSESAHAILPAAGIVFVIKI